MGIQMRSTKYSEMTVVAPTGGYTAGLLTKVQDVVGAIMEAAVAAASAVLVYKCDKIVVAKDTTTGNSFAKGDKVYYSGNKVYNSSTKPTGAVLCGVATETATSAATTVEIDLDGTLGITS